ncbi:phosphatase 2C-like domain-containing protein [Syncephalis fuscata]|nr:phosphatase 2C-like domain-containing protein [Syncephalis fuscata]
MGQTLSEPVREKHSSEGSDDRFYYGASCMQGWRITMEDAHTTVLQLGSGKRVSFFGVYDGHGGQRVAEYTGRMLHLRIARDDAFAEGDYKKALKNGYLGLDIDIRNDPDYSNETSGCTAVSAIITEDNRIFVANAGDSRAVLSIDGEAKPLSFDHKPGNPDESARITNAGGFVEFGRGYLGNLALSRAIGDFEFKQNKLLSDEEQIVTSNPEITEHQITDKDEFIVLACDGIWDCLTSQKVIDYVRRGIAARMPLDKICERIMERCLAKESDLGGVGCDNMTITIVAILNGRTKEAWYDWIAPKATPLGPTDEGEQPIVQPTDDGDDDDLSTSPTPAGMQMFMRMLQSHAASNMGFTSAEEEEVKSPLYTEIDSAAAKSARQETAAADKEKDASHPDAPLLSQLVESPGPEPRTFEQTATSNQPTTAEEEKKNDHASTVPSSSEAQKSGSS